MASLDGGLHWTATGARVGTGFEASGFSKGLRPQGLGVCGRCEARRSKRTRGRKAGPPRSEPRQCASEGPLSPIALPAVSRAESARCALSAGVPSVPGESGS